MKSVGGHGTCWSCSLFDFEDCIDDTGKFLGQNFWVRTPLSTPLDVSWGASKEA